MNHRSLGQYPEAQRYYEQGLALFQQIGDRRGIAIGFINIGEILELQGDYAAAEASYRQALRLYWEMGSKRGVVESMRQISALELEQDNPNVADTLRAGLLGCLELGIPSELLMLVGVLARLLTRHGQAYEAARLMGLLNTHPAATAELRVNHLVKLVQHLQTAMTADTLETAMQQGSALDLEATVRAYLEKSALTA